MDTPQQLYDRVGFGSLPSPERHVRRLETIGCLFDLDPRSIGRANVLDIGCGDGTLLLGMACEFPDAVYVGVDSSAKHIETADERRKALELTNVTFIKADLEYFDWDGAAFDYVLSFGVFSWIPERLRPLLLKKISDLLSPTGLAAMSFNPWPGFQRQEVVKHLLGSFVSPTIEPKARADRARQLLTAAHEFLSDTTTIHVMAIREEIGHCLRQTDSYLLHGLLTQDASSIRLSDFLYMAGAADLSYVCDARPSLWKAQRFRVETTGEGASKLGLFASDSVALDCMLDLLAPAQLRTAVLSKRPVGDRQVAVSKIEGLYLSSHLVRPERSAPEWSGPETFFTPTGQEVEIKEQAHQELITSLSTQWPASRTSGELGVNPALTREQVNQQLYRWFLLELVELEVTAPKVAATVADKPLAFGLARQQALRQNWITTCRAGYYPVDSFMSALLPLCDGTRSEEMLIGALLEGRGGTLPEGVTRGDLTDAVKQALNQLCEAAVLV